jgi:CheY-like chemotaxis protein
VVDIGLPLLDGYEVARRLREALGSGILLIALTGYGQPEDRQRAFAAGFDHHFTKPANPNELVRLLKA